MATENEFKDIINGAFGDMASVDEEKDWQVCPAGNP
jgi:hypothetical protein